MKTTIILYHNRHEVLCIEDWNIAKEIHEDMKRLMVNNLHIQVLSLSLFVNRMKNGQSTFVTVTTHCVLPILQWYIYQQLLM